MRYGKRWFYAAGMRDRALKKVALCNTLKSKDWPEWASWSYMCGFYGWSAP